MEDLERVQGPGIRSAARKHMRSIEYVYIGDAVRVPATEMNEF